MICRATNGAPRLTRQNANLRWEARMLRFAFHAMDSSFNHFAISRSFWRLFLGLLFGAISFLPPLRAQTTSTIEGIVTDHQGLAISGAEVSVSSGTLAVSKKTTTDSSGNYQI